MMYHVCPGCGEFQVQKEVDPIQATARCPVCDHVQPFRLGPLFIVSGASGAGKSTVCQHLVRPGQAADFVILDSDILWMEAFHASEQWPHYFNMWLRMAWNINQSGRPLLLFGTGLGVPANMEPCLNRRYLSHIHYLALVCDGESQERRLRARPAWRGSDQSQALADQLNFNRWFQDQGPTQTPPIHLVDNSQLSVAETAQQVLAWARERRGDG